RRNRCIADGMRVLPGAAESMTGVVPPRVVVHPCRGDRATGLAQGIEQWKRRARRTGALGGVQQLLELLKCGAEDIPAPSLAGETRRSCTKPPHPGKLLLQIADSPVCHHREPYSDECAEGKVMQRAARSRRLQAGDAGLLVRSARTDLAPVFA